MAYIAIHWKLYPFHTLSILKIIIRVFSTFFLLLCIIILFLFFHWNNPSHYYTHVTYIQYIINIFLVRFLFYFGFCYFDDFDCFLYAYTRITKIKNKKKNGIGWEKLDKKFVDCIFLCVCSIECIYVRKDMVYCMYINIG